MKELLDLIDLVRNPQIKRKNFFEPKPGKATKEQLLFNRIYDNTLSSDEEAARSIYGIEATEKRYMMLRKQLTDDLLQTLPMYNYSMILSETNNEIIGCYRSYIAIAILLLKSKRAAATSLAKRLLKKAKALQLTDMQIRLYRIIRESASLGGNSRDFGQCTECLEKLLRQQERELRAEGVCQSIELYYNHRTNSDPSSAEFAEKYLEAEKNLPVLESYHLQLNLFRIQLMVYSIRHDFPELIDTCTKAIAWLELHPKLANNARKLEFIVAAVNPAIRLRRFTLALDYSRLSLQFYTKGSRNWYIAAARLVQAYICMGEFSNAIHVFAQAVIDTKYEELDAFRKERWIILGALLAFFLNQEEITRYSIKDRRAIRLLQKTGLWDGMELALIDKEGLNLTVQILQLLFTLDKKDMTEAKAKIHLIRKYLKRTKTTNVDRTIIFLEIINSYVKQNRKTEAEIAVNVQILRTITLLDDAEYIPYEQLLSRILALNKAL